jgi:hypothetical protein
LTGNQRAGGFPSFPGPQVYTHATGGLGLSSAAAIRIGESEHTTSGGGGFVRGAVAQGSVLHQKLKLGPVTYPPDRLIGAGGHSILLVVHRHSWPKNSIKNKKRLLSKWLISKAINNWNYSICVDVMYTPLYTQ